MRSVIFTISDKRRKAKSERQNGASLLARRCLILPFTLFLLTLTTPSQRVAIVTPDGSPQSKEFAERVVTALAGKVTVLDSDLVSIAYRSVSHDSPFNLTAAESKLTGTTIGCDFLILLKSATQRRSAFRRNEYYESYAHIFVVSSRTGRLVFWKNQKHEAPKPDAAAKQLSDAADDLSKEIVAAIKSTQKHEVSESPPPPIEEVPEPDSAAAKDFKAPIPYRRIKPEYTAEAALYGVAATVEILVDTDQNGVITRTEIVRWAGYGLDESVEKTVRAMNWRPAMRAQRALPMRFLLRYNFKRIEKEDQ